MITEKALHLADWGYDGISVFLERSVWTEEVRAELLALEETTGVVPCEFVFLSDDYGKLMSSEERGRQTCREMYTESVEVCVALGAVTELEYEYGARNPMPLFDPYLRPSDNERAGFIDVYRQLASGASGSAAQVLLEPLNRYESRFFNSVEDSAELITELNASNTGLLLDFFHMSIEEASIPDAITAAGDLTRHVHLADNNRLLPGLGSLDWSASFEALHAIGYRGYLSLECSTSGQAEQTLPAAAAFLRGYIG